ncbi:MAG: F0F1 ATP synthase subunit delta [Chloroflexi bacterium]|nr:MAG: F0F1 ATP synthase subunit delta [Chloroflexota bacterium]
MTAPSRSCGPRCAISWWRPRRGCSARRSIARRISGSSTSRSPRSLTAAARERGGTDVARVSSIARRYAEAYFALAREAGDVAGRRPELQAVAAAFAREDIVRALENPKLSLVERVKLGLNLLEGVATPARNLARLLIERRRVRVAGEILAHFDVLADRAAGVVRAEVLTAIAIDDRMRDRIARTLEDRVGGKVHTTVRQDPGIVGGLVIRIGDRVIDDSVRTHLQQLQTALA